MNLQWMFLFLFSALAIRDVIQKKMVDKIAPESLILIFVVANILVGVCLYAFVFERSKIHQDFTRVLTLKDVSLIILSSLVGIVFTYYYYVIITPFLISNAHFIGQKNKKKM